MLGLFSVLHGNAAAGRPKVNDIQLGYRRDGFHWDRPSREAFITVSDDVKAWNVGNVQSVGGCCCVVGDRLYFYHSGRNAAMDQTGVAFLRRDGFALMNADETSGTLTTRPVTFPTSLTIGSSLGSKQPGEIYFYYSVLTQLYHPSMLKLGGHPSSSMTNHCSHEQTRSPPYRRRFGGAFLLSDRPDQTDELCRNAALQGIGGL